MLSAKKDLKLFELQDLERKNRFEKEKKIFYKKINRIRLKKINDKIPEDITIDIPYIEIIESKVIKDLIIKNIRSEKKLKNLNKYIKRLKSKNHLTNLLALISIRKLIKQNKFIIQKLLDKNIIIILLNIILFIDNKELKLEAILILKYLICQNTEIKKNLIQKEIINIIIKDFTKYCEIIRFEISDLLLLLSEDLELEVKLSFFSQIENILNLYKMGWKDKIEKNFIIIFSNLCQDNEEDFDDFTNDIVPVLFEPFKKSENKEIIKLCIFGFYLHSDKNIHEFFRIQFLNKLKLIYKNTDDFNIIFAINFIFGNISLYVSEDNYNIFLNDDFLKVFIEKLDYGNEQITIQIFWILSNLVFGTFEDIKRIIYNEIMINKIFSEASGDNPKIIFEALWIFFNLSKSKNFEIFQLLIKKGLFLLLKKLLESNKMEKKTIILILEGIFIFCEEFERLGKIKDFSDYLIEKNFLCTLENLLYHENDTIYIKTSIILDNFFELE